MFSLPASSVSTHLRSSPNLWLGEVVATFGLLLVPPAIASNRAIADRDAQLEKLASDPLSAPLPVVARPDRDQVPYLGTEMRTSATGAGLPTPEQAPALTMPAHDGLGCDEGQMLAPAGAEPASQDPQQPVLEAKPSTGSASSRTG